MAGRAGKLQGFIQEALDATCKALEIGGVFRRQKESWGQDIEVTYHET